MAHKTHKQVKENKHEVIITSISFNSMYNKLQVYTKRESKLYPYDEKIRHHCNKEKINY